MNVCLNGVFYDADAPVLTAQNRSFKFGDGVFETMKVYHNKLLLENLHFERLFGSLLLLQIDRKDSFTEAILKENILGLCRRNNCETLARVRVTVYRDEDNKTGYVIEATPLDAEVNEWKKEGVSLVLYPYVRKSIDAFSNLKSVNYLPYVMAARYVTEHNAGDALILNTANNLCEVSKANIFLIKNGVVVTPSLQQGCVNGVMRRIVMDVTQKLAIPLRQGAIPEEDLLSADEVFLTNAIQQIRWVKNYRHVEYRHNQTFKIFGAVKQANLS